jgi:group I intron endonuclease
MIIYRILNKINGKSYIGQTIKKFEYRKYNHYSDAFKYDKQTAIHRALRKYGMKNFIWDIICECVSADKLNEMESYYIEKYDTFGKNGYNMTTGGEGYVVSDEGRENMSIAHTGRPRGPMSEETKRKIGKSNTGKLRLEKTKEILRQLYIGKTYEEIHGKEKAIIIKNSISATLMGHETSNETRKKIGDAHRGKIVSEDAKMKNRESHLGKCHSDETKLKIGKARKGVKQKLAICPHCGLEGGIYNMKR